MCEKLVPNSTQGSLGGREMDWNGLIIFTVVDKEIHICKACKKSFFDFMEGKK